METLQDRISQAERRVTQLRQNPTPTIPEYDLQSSSVIVPIIIAVIAGSDVGSTSRILTIDNTGTLAIQSDPSFSNNSGFAVAWSGSRWVMSCDNDFLISLDGINWTNVASPFNSAFDVRWCSSYFTACGQVSGNAPLIARSVDSSGTTWENETTDWDTINGSFVNGIGYSTAANQRIACGSDGDDNYVIMRSDAGGDWHSVTTPEFGNQAYRAEWSDDLGLWVVVGAFGSGGSIMTSPDGITWTVQVSGGIGFDVCWSQFLGIFAAAYSSGGIVKTSPDGTTWTNQTTPLIGHNGIASAPDIASLLATSDALAAIASSSTGVSWTNIPSGFNGQRCAIRPQP